MSLDSLASESLQQLYDGAQILFENIENTTLDSNSEELQAEIQRCLCSYEHLTMMVSQVSLFSSNESIEELPTSSIKFLLLPARLGVLTLQRQYRRTSPSSHMETSNDSSSRNVSNSGCQSSTNLIPDRLTVLKMAKIYFEDFITRCKQYELTFIELPKDESEVVPQSNSMTVRGGRPTPEQLKAMGREREEKVRQFREKKELEAKIKHLATADIATANEETQRDFYTSLVIHAISESIEGLQGIRMERSMLQRGPPAPDANKPAPTTQPIRTFLITRDAAQKQVYGLGYPSLPIMSVDEFYEKRVRDGWWPPGCSDGSANRSVVAQHGDAASLEPHRPDADRGEDEGDGDRDRESLMARDEHRDVHRTGWGNTYNRS